MKDKTLNSGYSITFFASKGICPGFIDERFENSKEHTMSIIYNSSNTLFYQINIAGSGLNSELRRFILTGDHWYKVEAYLKLLLNYCSPVEIPAILSIIYESIEKDILFAEMYELFESFTISKQKIDQMFCCIANKSNNSKI